jgi:hypothetical protein
MNEISCPNWFDLSEPAHGNAGVPRFWPLWSMPHAIGRFCCGFLLDPFGLTCASEASPWILLCFLRSAHAPSSSFFHPTVTWKRSSSASESLGLMQKFQPLLQACHCCDLCSQPTPEQGTLGWNTGPGWPWASPGASPSP